MDISIFEVVGPIMMGPSSSGTAGMYRLGAAARQFLPGEPKRVDLCFTPRFSTGYLACRSHVALVAGLLGLAEDDPGQRNALEMARERAVELTTSVFAEPVPSHALTVEITVLTQEGAISSILGTSVGGGSIELSKVDGCPIAPVPAAAHIFLWCRADDLDNVAHLLHTPDCSASSHSGQGLLYFPVKTVPSGQELDAFRAIPGVTRAAYCAPFLPVGYVPHKPLFTTTEELLDLSRRTGKDLSDLAIAYELNRSGRSRESIWQQMSDNLTAMKKAAYISLKEEIRPLYGFDSGNGGKLLLESMASRRSLGGPVFTKSLAIGIGTMEYSMSMGFVVAAPTGGSSGIVPGCILATGEELGYTDEELIRALFVCALPGVIMHYHGVSFSGSQGGCQGEVGVSSAMAAAGLTYLRTRNAEQVFHAVALAVKNILGLVCDPLRGCDEVPCVKRNGVGIGNAFSAAEMAIAGICSFIPSDEAMLSLLHVQKIMPPEMRGYGCGANQTATGKAAEKMALEMVRHITLPVSTWAREAVCQNCGCCDAPPPL